MTGQHDRGERAAVDGIQWALDQIDAELRWQVEQIYRTGRFANRDKYHRYAIARLREVRGCIAMARGGDDA